MASALSPAPGPIGLGRRGVEWGLLLLVILVVVLVFLRQQRVVQGQAELAAVKTTLAALRTAFVVSHLQGQVAETQGGVVIAQRNPFALLQRPPINYRGEVGAGQAAAADPGSWFYDPMCGCVGYVPIDGQWLSDASGTTDIRYRVSTGPGPLQLRAMQAYIAKDGGESLPP